MFGEFIEDHDKEITILYYVDNNTMPLKGILKHYQNRLRLD